MHGELLDAGTKFRVIGQVGVGNIDLTAAAERGIRMHTARGAERFSSFNGRPASSFAAHLSTRTEAVMIHFVLVSPTCPSRVEAAWTVRTRTRSDALEPTARALASYGCSASASARIEATCTAVRPLPSAICARQLVPSATMRVSGAAFRTVGSKEISPIASESS